MAKAHIYVRAQVTDSNEAIDRIAAVTAALKAFIDAAGGGACQCSVEWDEIEAVEQTVEDSDAVS